MYPFSFICPCSASSPPRHLVLLDQSSSLKGECPSASSHAPSSHGERLRLHAVYRDLCCTLSWMQGGFLASCWLFMLQYHS